MYFANYLLLIDYIVIMHLHTINSLILYFTGGGWVAVALNRAKKVKQHERPVACVDEKQPDSLSAEIPVQDFGVGWRRMRLTLFSFRSLTSSYDSS